LAGLHPLFSQDSLKTTQDSIVVTGQIVANKNTPIKDVSVSVEGMRTAPALTNENGEFKITVPSGDMWLMINPIGEYQEKRVFLNNRKELTISLAEQGMKSGFDNIQLINQTKKRRDVVTSYTDIDVEEVKYENTATIDKALQGRVPGMHTTNHSGMPGKGAVNLIRGINSMNTSNAPLIIVDGMPLEQPGLFGSKIEGNAYNPLTTLDPRDISKVTILKDPTATALYGSKASNGVILIKTLEPKSTQTSIKVSLQSGLNLSPNNLIPQLNDEQYKTLANEILTSSPKREEEFKEDYPGLYIDKSDEEYYRYIHNTDWQKLVFTNSLSNEAYVSVKGGSEIATYGLSVGYHNQGGIFENSRYNRFNVRFVSNFNVFSWFDMDFNASLSNNNSYLKESAASPQTSPIMTSLSKPPILSPYQYNERGQKMALLDEVDELGTSNPVTVMENFQGENKNYRFISSVKGEGDLSENLKLNTLLGINLNTMKEFVFMPNKGMETYFEGEAHNVSQSTNNYLYSFYTDNHLDFNKQFSSIHSFNTSVGFRLHTNSLQVDIGETKNLPKNDQYTSLQSGQSDLRVLGGTNSTWNWLSAYHQLSYKYADKYIINTSLSADFSSRTGGKAETAFKLFDDMPFGLFYSAGAGWRLSNENFLKNADGLDKLMLRASYGVTGNNDIGNYNALNYYRLVRYRETSGLVPGVLPNEKLRFEKNKELNAGLDLSLWASRTRLSVNYFIRNTEDMLIYKPQKSYIGYDYKPINGGGVQNTGIELSFFQRIVDGNKFEWDFSSDLTMLSNEVTDIEGDQLVTSFEGGEFVTEKGSPINSFYGYQFEGVYSTHEEAEKANLVNASGISYGAGDAKFKDISGPENKPDGIINDYDKTNLGSPIPEFFGSVSNTFEYNRWSLDMRVQFVYGNEVFNYSRYMNESMMDLSNQSKNVLKRWQYEGDDTNVPRALWKDPVGNSDFSSRWIEDGSYIRLKSVTLGYTIPEEFLVFKNADFYVTATNLFTLDKYLGYDPEFSYSYNVMRQGIDYGLMPQYRQFLFGIKLGL
jgi:TonB-linked SusC/RagA family outer membrane protein